ncbi:13487_t:CDS:2, partial [Rhizophagus irregularis]
KVLSKAELLKEFDSTFTSLSSPSDACISNCRKLQDSLSHEDDNYLEDFPDMASDLIIQPVISGEINENLLLGSLSYSICAPPTASNKSISDILSPSLVKLVDKDFSYYTLLDSNEVSNLMSDLGLSSFEATRKAAKFAAVQVFAKNQFASPFSVTPL